MMTAGAPTAAACNIGPRQRAFRWRLGMLAAAAGVLVVALVAALDLPRGLSLAAGPLFWGGAIGYFEARQQTCVWLAARGRRNLDAGEEAVRDRAERALLRRQARRVYGRAAVAAVGLTALGWLLV
ncbi:MAG: hypothetical protein OER21_13720 [Gemmatimonadota bacterium]|nr:hypothetical protein [Gemmatimonadota bacterium]